MSCRKHSGPFALARYAVVAALIAVAGPLRAASVTVSIDGVKAELRENILQSLSIRHESGEDLPLSRIRRLHQRAPDEIRMALQPFGYYRAQIRADLHEQDGTWSARYEIDPGLPIPVATIDVQIVGEGQQDSVYQKLVNEFPLQPGDPLRHPLYEQAKSTFQRAAAERGYFDQRLRRHDVTVDLENYRADIHLHIDTGRRYRFGAIEIDQDILDPAFVARYVRIVSGQPYSASALLDLQTTLSGTDYFGLVEVIADPALAQDYAIPVRIRLGSRKPDKYTFGVGYGTDTGARGQIGWERRYVNPEGHHLRAELRGSRIERSLFSGYFIPIRDPRTDQIAITAGYTATDIQDTDTEVRRLAVSRTVLRGHLQETLSLTRQNEKFTIGGAETGTSELLLPGVAWSYFWGNERIYTRQGARAQLDVRGASEQFASDTRLLQARFQLKAILPVADVGRFILRGDVGATQIDELSRLPPSLRFYAGGDVSVRGYAYNSLGPRNSTGTVTGATNLLVGSVEYEQRIAGNWAAAAFYDAGNALNDFADPLQKGAGIGVRWRSPVGQIRLDAASALSNPDRPTRFHLYIGPDL